MIDVRDLTRRFANLTAVDDISFRLESGEVVGFLGPNGAGKTTTMRVLTGYLPASSASRVEVAGHDVLRQSMEVRKRIGYLPESVPLYRELRVREMMAFQGRLHNISRFELKRRIPEVLERVGVLDRERQLVGKLSRGLRQRVGLAVALLPRPEVLILDEPTSGLDPLQRREVRELIRELADDHTVLLSTHILAEIENICPRVIILNEGKIVADGTQASLVERFAGRGHVRFEAAVGDAAAARELMLTLEAVEEVSSHGRVGVHDVFTVIGEGDLREDLGAVAMARGWAVRELSWARPTLEELFAKLVLGTAELTIGAAPPAAPGGAVADTAPDGLLQLAPDAGSPAAGPEAAPPEAQEKIIYSLNPFDQGAGRDLGKPMSLGGAPAGEGVGPEGPCDGEEEA